MKEALNKVLKSCSFGEGRGGEKICLFRGFLILLLVYLSWESEATYPTIQQDSGIVLSSRPHAGERAPALQLLVLVSLPPFSLRLNFI